MNLLLAIALVRVTMATPPLPRLLVSLAPIFSPHSTDTPEIKALNVTLTLSGIPYLSPMLTLLLNNGATRTLQYSTLPAFDAQGPLPLASYTDTNTSNAQRFWSATRKPVGDVIINLVAEPPADLGVGNGPRIDLRRDQGGLVGMGEGFIPRPAVDEEWDVTVRWEWEGELPRGVRAVCSLGGGREVRAQGRPGRVLAKSYFAVGRLERWPPWGEVVEEKGGFAMYWIGELPWEVEGLGARMRALTGAVRAFFGEGSDAFRVFWRRAGMGYGGAGGFRSFMMEYADFAEEELLAEGLENLIAHESVHEYALMNPVRQEDVWYREGVAVYYAVVAPFLAGVVDKGYFVGWMNNNAQAYYTGGTTGLDWQYVLAHYWTGTQLVRTSYFRGFIYLAHVQGLVSQATNGSKGLDDVVLELYRRYKAHYVVQGEHFVGVLGDYIGKTAAEASFEEMKSGKLIAPTPDSLARFGLRMVRKDAENLELGFSEGSLGRRIITDLVPGSRAEEAGLRGGDEIMRFWVFSTAGDSLANELKIVVKRDGKEIAITYRPRSYERVECYQWVDTYQEP